MKTKIIPMFVVSIGMLLAGAGSMKIWMLYEMGALGLADFGLIGLTVFGFLISLGTQYVSLAKSKNSLPTKDF